MKLGFRPGLGIALLLGALLPAPARAALTNIEVLGPTGQPIADATVSFTAPDGEEQQQKTNDKGIAALNLAGNTDYRLRAFDSRHLFSERTITGGAASYSFGFQRPDGTHLRYPQRRDFGFSIGYFGESHDDLGFDRGNAVLEKPGIPPQQEEFGAAGDTSDLSLRGAYGELDHGLYRFGRGPVALDVFARARAGWGGLTFKERSNAPSFPGVDFSGSGLFWSLGIGGRLATDWPVDLVAGFERRSLAGVDLDQSPDYFNGFTDGDGAYRDWRLHIGVAAPLDRFFQFRRPCWGRTTIEAGAVATWSDARFSFTRYDMSFPDISIRSTKDFSETSIRGYLGAGFPVYRNLMGHVGAEFGEGGWGYTFSVGLWGHSPLSY